MEKYCRAGQATDGSTVWHMRIACRIPKATNTHSQHVMSIAVPQQQCLQERATMLRYACLVTYTQPLAKV